MSLSRCRRRGSILVWVLLHLGFHAFRAQAVEVSHLEVFENGDFWIAPAAWDAPPKTESRLASFPTFAHAVLRWSSEDALLAASVLQAEIEKRIAQNKHVTLSTSESESALSLEIEILNRELGRRHAPRTSGGIIFSYSKRLGDPARGGYSASFQTETNDVFTHPDRRYYPGVTAIAEITNQSNQVLWAHEFRIPSTDQRLRGYTQSEIQTDPERLRDSWRKICIELSTEIVRRLASNRRRIAKASDADGDANIQELPSESYLDGHWVFPRAPMQRTWVIEYPPMAKDDARAGHVLLGVFVREDGRIDKVEIVESEPQGLFDSYAIQCISRARFVPATHQNRPVKYVTWARLDFDPTQ